MTDAVVAGAGIGGLAAAAFLARQDFDVLVVEQHSEPRAGGAGILLQPNGLAVLAALGVVERLRDEGSILRTMRLLDERLHPVSEVAVPGGDEHGYALVVDRGHLHRCLLDAAESAGVTVELGRRLASIGAGAVEPIARFDGLPEMPVRLLVGADGQDSVTRGHVDPDATTTRGRDYCRALVDWRCAEPLTGEYWTRRGIAGIFPCGSGRTYWYCTATPAIVEADRQGDLMRLRKKIAVAHPPLVQAVESVVDAGAVRVDHVIEVNVDQLYRGNVVLVGDAAHAMAPNLGQGANSALVDAAVLAGELLRRNGVSEALAAYDARRCEVVRSVQVDARRLARLAHVTQGRRLRNAVMRLVPSRYAASRARRAMQVDLSTFRDELTSLTDVA